MDGHASRRIDICLRPSETIENAVRNIYAGPIAAGVRPNKSAAVVGIPSK